MDEPNSFNFQSKPSGKSSSAVIRGNASVDGSVTQFQLDGVFYDHMIHFTATDGDKVMTFDGMFVDVGRMHLVHQESQGHMVLTCTGACM